MTNKKDSQAYENRANGLIWAGIVFVFTTLFLFLLKTTEINSGLTLDTNILDHFGSLIGGIVGVMFSLAGIFLLIQTLRNQEKIIIKIKSSKGFTN